MRKLRHREVTCLPHGHAAAEWPSLAPKQSGPRHSPRPCYLTVSVTPQCTSNIPRGLVSQAIAREMQQPQGQGHSYNTPSRSRVMPTVTTDGRTRTRRHRGLVPRSVRADSPGESSRAMAWACLLGTEPRGRRAGHVRGCTRPLQAELSVLTQPVWQMAFWNEVKRRISPRKGGYCFMKLVSELYGVYAVLQDKFIFLLWVLSENVGVPLFLLKKL